MTDSDAIWVFEQLKKRHPTHTIRILLGSSDGPGVAINEKVFNVPYQNLLNEVNARRHYNETEVEVDRLWTILTYIENQAGLKVSYDR